VNTSGKLMRNSKGIDFSFIVQIRFLCFGKRTKCGQERSNAELVRATPHRVAKVCVSVRSLSKRTLKTHMIAAPQSRQNERNLLKIICSLLAVAPLQRELPCGSDGGNASFELPRPIAVKEEAFSAIKVKHILSVQLSKRTRTKSFVIKNEMAQDVCEECGARNVYARDLPQRNGIRSIALKARLINIDANAR